jgi:hypothetical protein
MSQRRNSEAAALIARIATMAGAVPERAVDVGAAMFMRSYPFTVAQSMSVVKSSGR